MTRNTDSEGSKDASRQTTLRLRIEENHEFYSNRCDLMDQFDQRAASDLFLCIAERIVTCVNACAGIQNPAAIPNLIKAALEAVEASSRHSTKEGTDRAMNQAIRDLFKALAALDSPVPKAQQTPAVSIDNPEETSHLPGCPSEYGDL